MLTALSDLLQCVAIIPVAIVMTGYRCFRGETALARDTWDALCEAIIADEED
jgi:hypothetical protein